MWFGLARFLPYVVVVAWFVFLLGALGRGAWIRAGVYFVLMALSVAGIVEKRRRERNESGPSAGRDTD